MFAFHASKTGSEQLCVAWAKRELKQQVGAAPCRSRKDGRDCACRLLSGCLEAVGENTLKHAN